PGLTPEFTNNVTMSDIQSTTVLSLDYTAATPQPHPFPTRRSSDLEQRAHPRRSWCFSSRRQKAFRKRRARHCEAHGKLYAFVTRSEEHTSELQSRGHIVCCLLLEKKKNI